MLRILLVWGPHFENHCHRVILASCVQSTRKDRLYMQNYAESDNNLVQATVMSCQHYYNSLLTDSPSPALALLWTSVNKAVRMILLKQKEILSPFSYNSIMLPTSLRWKAKILISSRGKDLAPFPPIVFLIHLASAMLASQLLLKHSRSILTSGHIHYLSLLPGVSFAQNPSG